MLASHNTLTYMRPRQWWARLCPWAWRCQTLTLCGQTVSGAALLDIRVCRHRGRWWAAHGLVRLGTEGSVTLMGLLRLHAIPEDMPVRIILERGTEADEAAFAVALPIVMQRYDITCAAVKRGWRVLHSDPRDALGRDNYYKPFDSARSLGKNLRNLLRHPSTIARYARSTHPHRDEWRADGLYHFIDHI